MDERGPLRGARSDFLKASYWETMDRIQIGFIITALVLVNTKNGGRNGNISPAHFGRRLVAALLSNGLHFPLGIFQSVK